MPKIIFLDRDGVINENRDDYVKSIDEIEIISGALEALKILKENDYTIIIVSNQSAIGRGIIDENTLKTINDKINDNLENLIDDFFYCPHKPTDKCSCRKPGTKLLEDAAEKYGENLEGTWIIGDNSLDIQLGRNAGCKTVLVKTGLGMTVLSKGEIKPDFVAENILDAVKIIIIEDDKRL